jgi:hypothetical protein
MRRFLAIALSFLLSTCHYAYARPGPQWADNPPEIRAWFNNLNQPDNPYVSCCGEADAFEADDFAQTADGHYVAIITDGKGLVPDGTRVSVPDNKIKWDKGNPTGHGWLFMGQGGMVYCYVTPGGV